MNAGFKDHIPEDLLEVYALGTLSDDASARVEEHLLVCVSCQAQLENTDEYIGVMKAATSSVADSVEQVALSLILEFAG